MKIVKLIGSLSEGKLNFLIGEWEFIKETNTYYEIKSEVNTKRLKKESLNKVEPTGNNDVRYISYHSFCTEDNIELVKKEIIAKIERYLTISRQILDR